MSNPETATAPKPSAKDRMAHARSFRGKDRETPAAAGTPAKPELQMKAKPNWEDMDTAPEHAQGRLHIPAEDIPDGMSLEWVVDTIYGQPQAQSRAQKEKAGWTPVHPSDFGGLYDGRFMPKGFEGEINVDGLVLMARPKQLTDKAHARDVRKAREQVAIKERQLRGGDMPGVSFDTQHPSAMNATRINKTMEPIPIPSDE